MVACTHWLASAAGMSVLERGGNAADAAVAAGFVLQVVEPHLNGPGGEVPILLWDAADGRPYGSSPARASPPAAATLKHFAGLGLDLVPGYGPLAATVPGAFGAWMLLLERWGTWPLRDVLEPAIWYAENGWPLLPSIARTIETVQQTFVDDWPTSAERWLPLPAPGARMTQPGSCRNVAAASRRGRGGRRRPVSSRSRRRAPGVLRRVRRRGDRRRGSPARTRHAPASCTPGC